MHRKVVSAANASPAVTATPLPKKSFQTKPISIEESPVHALPSTAFDSASTPTSQHVRNSNTPPSSFGKRYGLIDSDDDDEKGPETRSLRASHKKTPQSRHSVTPKSVQFNLQANTSTNEKRSPIRSLKIDDDDGFHDHLRNKSQQSDGHNSPPSVHTNFDDLRKKKMMMTPDDDGELSPQQFAGEALFGEDIDNFNNSTDIPSMTPTSSAKKKRTPISYPKLTGSGTINLAYNFVEFHIILVCSSGRMYFTSPASPTPNKYVDKLHSTMVAIEQEVSAGCMRVRSICN